MTRGSSRVMDNGRRPTASGRLPLGLAALAIAAAGCGGKLDEDPARERGAGGSGGVAPGTVSGGAAVGGGATGSGGVAGVAGALSADSGAAGSGDHGCEALVGLPSDCGPSRVTADAEDPCRVTVSEPPEDEDYVNVAVDCEVVSRSTGDEDGSSWDYLPEELAVAIEGAACERLAAGEAKRVDVLFGCSIIW